MQQTQVATVVPYFLRWIEAFPRVNDLANAPEQGVLKLWEGLGYYARARNFHRAAMIVRDQFDGQVPDKYADFRSLPGVGEYTAAAVMSIAFGQPFAVVDGNVKRVLARLYLNDAPVNDVKSHRQYAQIAQDLLDPAAPSNHNQAMMELGALICRPRQPNCSDCPVQTFCLAQKEDAQLRYPQRISRKKIPQYKHVAVVLQRRQKLLIARRPEKGLLGGLWEFPDIRVAEGESTDATLQRLLQDDLAMSANDIRPLTTVSHTFTHFKMTVDVFVATAESEELNPARHSDYRWIVREQLTEYPFPGVQNKFLPQIVDAP